MTQSYYYDVGNDILDYPKADIIITYGGRGTGKTYSGLRYVIEHKLKFVFIKRTVEDIKLMCTGNKLGTIKDANTMQAEMDVSPFKPLNRDFGWNIRPFMLYKGVGGFFHCDKFGNATGDAVGYIVPLSIIGSIKGFDMSDAQVMIFDEFCPKNYERVSKHEQEEILDAYKTINRDREHRGLPALKLWAFANADDVNCPLTKAFDLVNQLAVMAMADREFYYRPLSEDGRGLLLHKLKTPEEFIKKEAESIIYKAAKRSKWAKSALNNDFAFNDFSQVKRRSLNGMKCIASVFYNEKTHYIYKHPDTGERYVTYSAAEYVPVAYDLNKESHITHFLNLADNIVVCRMYNPNLAEAYYEDYELFDLYMNGRKLLDN